MFAGQKKIALLPAEDPELDARAEWAERSGDEEEYQHWVIRERNEEFVRRVLESKRPIVYLLAGHKHDLRDAINCSNSEHDEQISLLVVRVKGINSTKLKQP